MYTKFRHWKQPTTQKTSGSPGDVSQHLDKAPQSTTLLLPSPSPALQFVNTTNPRQANSDEVIGLIRSHVAKEIHATRRQHRESRGQVLLKTSLRKSGAGTFSDCAKREPNRCGNKFNSVAEMRLPRVPNELPSPVTALGTARRDQLNTYARPLNDAESYLIDHFLIVIAPETSRNHDKEDLKIYRQWIQFALSDTGLLAALLLITCRCLSTPQCLELNDSLYDKLAMRYKGDCLRSMINAISKEGASISGTTITKAMVMCSYETKFGDNAIARQHANAISRMITLKGGLQKISAEDDIGRIIAFFYEQLNEEQSCP